MEFWGGVLGVGMAPLGVVKKPFIYIDLHIDVSLFLESFTNFRRKLEHWIFFAPIQVFEVFFRVGLCRRRRVDERENHCQLCS